jgi:hypothetical protein
MRVFAAAANGDVVLKDTKKRIKKNNPIFVLDNTFLMSSSLGDVKMSRLVLQRWTRRS